MTPDFLRGEAIAQIIGCMHTRPVGGTWSLESANTKDGATALLFKVGILMPDREGNIADNRQMVVITVQEIFDAAA